MEKKVYSVSLLNQYIKNIIEGDSLLCNILVQGEITNLTKHYTGHYYFSIKDENSKISCMMFSYSVKSLNFDLKNGDLVLIYGYLSVYEKTGTYQLYARHIEPFGLGQELLKIEALKKKLKEEGVFDRPKKEIPKYPKRIGIVTSSTGAAVKDLISTIQKRWNVEIYIFSCLVQGKEAPPSIIKALADADNYGVDTIILGRGGGSNEDLNAFNDEGVVRAVIALKTPIISAIGHQIDSSVTDLVSDYSCITPTDAGVKATPDKNQMIRELISQRDMIHQDIRLLIEKYQRMLLQITSNKCFVSPIEKLKRQNEENNKLKEKLSFIIKAILKEYQNKNSNYIGRLNSLNPYGVLKKGYSLVSSSSTKVITSINEVKENDEVIINMIDGKIKANVKEIMENK